MCVGIQIFELMTWITKEISQTLLPAVLYSSTEVRSLYLIQSDRKIMWFSSTIGDQNKTFAAHFCHCFSNKIVRFTFFVIESRFVAKNPNKSLLHYKKELTPKWESIIWPKTELERELSGQKTEIFEIICKRIQLQLKIRKIWELSFSK